MDGPVDLWHLQLHDLKMSECKWDGPVVKGTGTVLAMLSRKTASTHFQLNLVYWPRAGCMSSYKGRFEDTTSVHSVKQINDPQIIISMKPCPQVALTRVSRMFHKQRTGANMRRHCPHRYLLFLKCLKPRQPHRVTSGLLACFSTTQVNSPMPNP